MRRARETLNKFSDFHCKAEPCKNPHGLTGGSFPVERSRASCSTTF